LKALGRHVWPGMAAATAWAVAVGCGRIRSLEMSSAAENACPQNPCSAYVQANDVQCLAGACVIDPAEAPSTSDLVVLISVPSDAYFAPGRTFAIPFDDLANANTASSTQASPAELPAVGTAFGLYAVSPRLAQTVDWDLGTSGVTTSLPFHAVFRLLWPGSSGTEAALLGLPLSPVLADSVQLVDFLPGPGGGPETESQTYLQPGTYERTLIADPPFDEAFGPVTQVVTVSSGMSVDQEIIESYDTTGGQALPTFEITRSGGALDGWTAYLRDQNDRIVSSRAPLSGTTTSNVILAVKRSTDPTQPDLDALSQTELVVAPPAGAILPTGVFNLFGMVTPILYPTLPATVNLQGQITSQSGSPVAAAIVFEAISITTLSSVDDPTGVQNQTFEYTLSVNTTTDPSTGKSTYSATLPSGSYRIDVRPTNPLIEGSGGILDAGDAVTAAVQVASSVSLLQDQTMDFSLGGLQSAGGLARVLDGRPLSGAVVDAIPFGCTASLSKLPSTWCLPRPAQSTTLSNGSFEFDLDPGYFTLRVRPAAGTRLPWVVVTQPIFADATGPLSLAPVIVPAPQSLGLTLADPAGNPIANALVRLFRLPSLPSATLAVELGEAITGIDGSYEMYIAPPSP
jgi:hypothetical protein